MASPAEFPAPWTLKGSAVLISFPANKARVIESGILSAEDEDAFVGGVGAVMLVRYSAADCGPYDELLYIPGFFRFRGKCYLRIAKIFVSTPESVEWGRRNWAIPKELATFAWRQDEKEWHIDVKKPKSGDNIYSISLTPRFFSFPLSSSLLPLTLLQKQEEKYADGKTLYLETKLMGKGRSRIAFIDRVEGSREFPDYHDMSHGPRIAVAVDPFDLTFPVAREIV